MQPLLMAASMSRRFREVFARYLPLPADGERIWLGIDASSIQRPESKTARDRSVV